MATSLALAPAVPPELWGAAEAGVPGADDRFAPVCHLELGEDREDVVVDGLGSD
jgi:hypothetical protein